MMKKIYPYLILLLCLLISTLVWEYIKIPYNEENLIYGEYSSKKYNPINELLRFTFFIFFPLLFFLIAVLRQSNTANFFSSKNFFLKRELNFSNKCNNLNIVTFYLISFVFIDFFSLDFNKYISQVDFFHEGTFLVPPINTIATSKLWLSTMYDYGFIANNIGSIIYLFFDNFTIGSIKFSHLLWIALNKLLLILIARKIILSLNIETNYKPIFLIIFVFTIINLAHYHYPRISPFSPRSFLYLLFILFAIDVLLNQKRNIFMSLVLGFFSLVSIIWFIDVGFYTNALLVIILVYLIFEKEFSKFFFVFSGIILGWLIFFLFLPSQEIQEFFFQTKFIISISDYLLGIEYPKPFSEGSTRFTRALLLIILAGIFSINLLFYNRISASYETKIIIILLFLSSVLFFNSALMRSDTPHIKYSSGFYTYLVFFSVLFYIYCFAEKKNFLKNLKSPIFNNKITYLVVIVVIGSFYIIMGENRKINNIFNFYSNINNLLVAKNDSFLTSKQSKFIREYAIITKKDKCVQIFTDDISMPFFLNKPSCTQFYIPGHIVNGWTEDKFINQLKKNMPNYILYSSPINWLANRKNMPTADKFIKNNYSIYKKIEQWEIYKKN